MAGMGKCGSLEEVYFCIMLQYVSSFIMKFIEIRVQMTLLGARKWASLC